jgi:hypothetical protein
MPTFIECTVPSIIYLRGEVVVNDPVNLDLCKSLHKKNFAWYPDNKGKPAIKFEGCDVEWVYESESQREEDWKRIIKGTSL